MPTYSMPQANAAPVGDGNLTREVTRAFLSNPQFSQNFMNQAEQAMQPQPVAYEQGPGSINPRGLTEEELMARLIASEAGNHVADQPHVASVVMNRVASPKYPNSIHDVILQPGQFSAFNNFTKYANGSGANDVWKRPAPGSIFDLARTVMEGNPTTDALNYYNPDAASPAWGGEGFAAYPGTAHVYGNAR